MKTVRTYIEMTQALAAQTALSSHGIDSNIPNQDIPAPYAGNMGCVELQVSEADFDAARNLLDHPPLAAGDVPRNAPLPPAIVVESQADVKRWLSRLALAELTIDLGLYLWGQNWPITPPGSVQAYLESFNFGNALWELGYLVYNGGLILQAIGILFFIVQSRAGRWPFALGIGLQISVSWTMPASVSTGIGGGIWWISALLQGALLAVAFGLVRPKPSPIQPAPLTPSSGS